MCKNYRQFVVRLEEIYPAFGRNFGGFVLWFHEFHFMSPILPLPVTNFLAMRYRIGCSSAIANIRERKCDHLTRKGDKIFGRMGRGPCFLNGVEWQPKWMRWSNYERLCAEHGTVVDGNVGKLAVRFNLVGNCWRDGT